MLGILVMVLVVIFIILVLSNVLFRVLLFVGLVSPVCTSCLLGHSGALLMPLMFVSTSGESPPTLLFFAIGTCVDSVICSRL